MRKLFFCFILLFVSNAYAQDAVTLGKKHVNALAADDMKGRGYVGDGYESAVKYLEKQFASAKLKKFGKSYRQGFTYPVNTFPDSCSLALNGKYLKPGVHFLVDPSCGSTQGDFLPRYFTVAQLYMKMEPILGENEVAVIEAWSPKMSKDSVQFLQQRIAKLNAAAPVILLRKSKLVWSVGDFAWQHARIELMESNFDTTVKSIHINVCHYFQNRFQSYNVVGYVKALKKSDDYIVITAHLDHLGMMGSKSTFNGANDNASGIAMMLTLVEHYKRRLPKTNIVFIAFGGEEAGLIGSKYYVEHPLFPLQKIKFLLNLDLMGTGDEGITVVNATKFEKHFNHLKSINEKEKYLPLIKPRGEARNSDHYWFTQLGIPSFFIYTMGGTTAYHDINDRAEQLPLTKFQELHHLFTDFIDDVAAGRINP